MEVVNVRVKFLRKNGYENLLEWLKNPNHIYIGRNMVYVEGTYSSKWKNPFSVKIYGRDICIEMYIKHLNESGLIGDIHELKGKVLGCWCHPESCHGDLLVSLLK
jgi:hypothetical protein